MCDIIVLPEYKVLFKKQEMKKNIFDLYLNKLLDLPLWVKQVIYVKLKADMEKHNCAKILDTQEDDMFALFKPVLTYSGKTELMKKNGGLDSNIYNFLKLCNEDYSILEIALCMFLTMEEAAKYFMFCVEQKYLERPDSDKAFAMAGFISGKFKTGEYLVQNKMLSFNQVQDALNKQASVNSESETHLKYAEILDSMNLVKKDDLKMIFVLQEESKKRFVLDYNSVPNSERGFINDDEKTSAQIETLKCENKKLREKLMQLLKLVKKNV